MIRVILPARAKAHLDNGIPLHVVKTMYKGAMILTKAGFVQAYGRDMAEIRQLLRGQ